MTASRPVVILGGASGSIVAEALYDIGVAGGGLHGAGFLNDVLPMGSDIGGLPVLGLFDLWPSLPEETVFISVLHKAKLAPLRMKRIRRLGIPEDRWAVVRHPTATVARNVPVGPGTYIGPNAAVMPGARIGRHASLRPNCSVSHDTKLGDFVFVGPNATLNGNCLVGVGVHIGPNAVIHEETTIGEFAVVGMGSVVLEDVPARTLVAGNPARVVRRLNADGEWVRADGG
jgi:sugar O-acyltransferase (sialic acid O-acetyltransferase NeuD family)